MSIRSIIEARGHQTAKSMARRRWPRRNVIASGLLLALIGLGLFLASVHSADATHSSGWHIASIHNLYGDTRDREEYCVMTSGSNLDWYTTREEIRNILIYENPSGDCDGTANGKIDIWTETSAPCDQLSQARRNEIEIEYQIHDNTSAWCGSNVSCAVKAAPIYGLTQHTDYRWYYLYIRTGAYTHSNFNRHFVVNHEIGHAFGLADGGCGVNSIMHYGSGCYKDWPTNSDRSSVTSIAGYTGP